MHIALDLDPERIWIRVIFKMLDPYPQIFFAVSTSWYMYIQECVGCRYALLQRDVHERAHGERVQGAPDTQASLH